MKRLSSHRFHPCIKLMSVLMLMSSLAGCTSTVPETKAPESKSALQATNKLRTGDLAGALKDYNQAIAQNPKDADAYVNRGIAQDELGQHQAAIADYTKALELKPDRILAYYNRANAYHQLKENEKAIADYTKIISLDAKYSYAYANRGATYFVMGKKEAAIADLQKASEIFASKSDRKNVQRVQQQIEKWKTSTSKQ
jgi:tetratricopeptide (TPR) repeat protein